MNRREMFKLTSVTTVGVVCGATVLPMSSQGAFFLPAAAAPAAVALGKQLLVAVLRKLGTGSTALANKIAGVEQELDRTQFVVNTGGNFHERNGISILPKSDIKALDNGGVQDGSFWMEWEAKRLLRPLQGAGLAQAHKFSDLNEAELSFIKTTYVSQQQYEPFLPLTERRAFKFEEKRSEQEFAAFYHGLVLSEVPSAEMRSFILNDCQPMSYRWIHPGPQAGKPAILGVTYVNSRTGKPFLWTYNRPDADLKKRQPMMEKIITTVT